MLSMLLSEAAVITGINSLESQFQIFFFKKGRWIVINSNPAWYTGWVPDKLRLYSKALSQELRNKQKIQINNKKNL